MTNLPEELQAELVEAIRAVNRSLDMEEHAAAVAVHAPATFVAMLDSKKIVQAVLAKLPPPVDPDIEEARKLRLIAGMPKSNIPHPTYPRERIIGWRVPEEIAGLSDGLFIVDAVERLALRFLEHRSELERASQ